MYRIVQLIALILALSYGAMAQSTQGLVAYYPFSGNANDASGNGNNGAVPLSGPVLTADRFGFPNSAYSFDGVNDSIVVLDADVLDIDSGTVCCWVRYNGGSIHPRLVSKGPAYEIYINTNLNGVLGANINSNPLNSGYSMPIGNWVHVSLVKTSDSVFIYANADRVLSAHISSPINHSSLNLLLGRNPAPATDDWLNGDLDEVLIYNRPLSSDEISHLVSKSLDTLRIGVPTCLQSLLPTQQTIPIYLDNTDTVKGLDIPMSYTWSVDPDSISFVGTRLSGVQGALRSIDAGTNRMRVVWTWSGDPAELMLPIDVNSANVPIAKIFIPANYACSDDLVNPPDTATVMLPLGPIHVEVTDKFAAKTVPVIVADNTLVRHYLKGDANWDESVSISDPVFLINYIFAGGAAPFCSIAADADGNAIGNISDAVFLINYVFAGGPTPGADDLCSPPPSFPKAAIGHANIASRSSANETATAIAVSLGNSSDARAVQLEFAITGDVRNIQINSYVSELQLFSSEVEGGYRVGLIDLTGTAAIRSGTSQIATITYEGNGELTVSSAIVVDNDASEMNVTIANAKVESVLPKDYSLSQNQPNPFNPATDISFSLPNAGQVKLVVYNILGAEVATLVDEVRSAGVHRVTWDGRDNSGKQVASGIYLYRLTAGDFAATKKMMLLK